MNTLNIVPFGPSAGVVRKSRDRCVHAALPICRIDRPLDAELAASFKELGSRSRVNGGSHARSA
ncbi:hypothetical protein [Streptomyces sp. NPDC055709]